MAITPTQRGKTRRSPLYSIPINDRFILKPHRSANAWWRRETKVQLLLAMLREGYKISEACKKAGITVAQYKYFVRRHPGFNDIRKYYNELLLNDARKSIAFGIAKNKKFALKYLNKTKPDEFPPPRLLKKVTALEEQLLGERERFLDELRQLKIIIGMYMEVTQGLTLGGWPKNRVVQAENAVRRYNSAHRRNNEMIRRYDSARSAKTPA